MKFISFFLIFILPIGAKSLDISRNNILSQPSEQTSSKKRESSNYDCSEEVKQLETTFNKLIESLKPIETIRELIKWYHTQSRSMYVFF